jgi:protein transport protein SEC23
MTMKARIGKAAMVSKELSKEIRSHKDLEKDAAPFWRPAVQFYEELSRSLVKNALTLDVFACALEQSGLAEMKPAIQASGGLVVQTDTFKNPVFKDSLTRVFAKPEEQGFCGRSSCATLEVFCSRDIKVTVRCLRLC